MGWNPRSALCYILNGKNVCPDVFLFLIRSMPAFVMIAAGWQAVKIIEIRDGKKKIIRSYRRFHRQYRTVLYSLERIYFFLSFFLSIQ